VEKNPEAKSAGCSETDSLFSFSSILFFQNDCAPHHLAFQDFLKPRAGARNPTGNPVTKRRKGSGAAVF